MVRYGVSRNVAAIDEAGKDVRLAIVVIEYENGYKQTRCINEELIRFAGEGIIENEVKQMAVGHEVRLG